MAADIYHPDQWRDFFVLVGTGAAALTGFVFVAMSINLKSITADVTHRTRAIGLLLGFAAVFIRSALVVMGGQEQKAVGIELLVVSAVAGMVFVAGYFRAVNSDGARSRPSLSR